MYMLEILALLIAGHALADYPPQGDFLSKAKNHMQPIVGAPWYQALLAHSAIHGGMVGLITGSIWLGLAEFVVHNLIDYAKCDGKLTFNQDQILHVVCKLVWWGVLISYGA